MEYITSMNLSKIWKITPRQISKLCSVGKIEGAKKIGKTWYIPIDAKRPLDNRIKSGNYLDWRYKYGKIAYIGGINMHSNWTTEVFKSKDEDFEYDRKSAKIKPKDLARNIIAFANSDGGTIAIGIEDDKTITGIDDFTTSINELRYAASKLIRPSVPCTYERIPVIDYQGKNNYVLLIHVPMGEKVHEDTAGDAFYRVGDKSVKMSFEERLTLAYARGEQNYEVSPVFGSSIEDIERQRVEEYMKKIGYSLPYDNYINENHFIVNSKGEVSVKAILLFGKKPQYYFERARIRFVRFEGTEELTGAHMNVIKEAEFNGRLLEQLNDAIAFVRTQIKERSFLGKDGLFVTIPEYPEFCWKELIVNAVTHRDYSISGTDIIIKMFDDKIVVESPGAFPGNVTEKNIKTTHFSRNKAIAAYMKTYGFVKEFGEGVKRIYKEMSDFGLVSPTFKKQDFMTIATIKNITLSQDVSVNGTLKKQLGTRENKNGTQNGTQNGQFGTLEDEDGTSKIDKVLMDGTLKEQLGTRENKNGTQNGQFGTLEDENDTSKIDKVLINGTLKKQLGTQKNLNNNEINIIIEMIKQNPTVTREQLAIALGKSKRTIQRIIENSSKIKYVGKGKHGHWEIEE